MKTVEARGSHRAIGEAIGEGLRGEIALHVDAFVRRTPEEMSSGVKHLRQALESYAPHVLEQFEGMSAGSDLPLERLLALNTPEGGPLHMFERQGCTNIVFADGPDGPLWGKNNDGGHAPQDGPIIEGKGQRPRAALKIYPDDGIPAICVTFCGWLSGGDMMNAEGVAAGHSSVGSRFRQTPLHVPVLQWMYWIMFRSKTAYHYQKNLTMLPLYGKGFTQAVVDRDGAICSPEIACPLVQIRYPEENQTAMHCVNHYQLPELDGIDRRSPEGLKNSQARSQFLSNEVDQGDHSIEHMKQILAHHGDPSICRHGGQDRSWTEYSMIGVSKDPCMLVADGNPCENDYVKLTI